MTICEEKVDTSKSSFVVKHANGKTINDIVKAKLSEESDTQVPPTVQGNRRLMKENYLF